MSDSENGFPDLPPYTYVPGFAVHPISHPDGHMRDFEVPQVWSNAQFLQWGKRLFNNGYYWEAHEAWEHLWLNLGRTTAEALAVKGLIKLAASGVKCREGNAVGATRHAVRCVELLQAGSSSVLFEDCNLAVVKGVAESIVKSAPVRFVEPSSQPVCLPGMQI